MKQCIAIPSCITVVYHAAEQKCWFYEGDDLYADEATIVPMIGSKIISLGEKRSCFLIFWNVCVKFDIFKLEMKKGRDFSQN